MLPATVDENDERCRFIFEDGERAGQQCPARRLPDAAFCKACKDALEAYDKEVMRAKAALDKRIATKTYRTRTTKEVAECLEDVINGVLKGTIKRDKAAPLALFLPLAFNIAKYREANGPIDNTAGFTMTVEERRTSVVMNLSDEEMDAYIAGDRTLKTKMLEDLAAKGKLNETTKENVIDVQAENVDVQDLPINHKALAKLSTKTDIPLTEKQSVQLFGKVLGKNQGLSYDAAGTNFDATGFSQIFENKPESLPIEARVRPHKFKGVFETDEATRRQYLRYTCEYCGKKVANIDKPVSVKKEHCEKAPYEVPNEHNQD